MAYPQTWPAGSAGPLVIPDAGGFVIDCNIIETKLNITPDAVDDWLAGMDLVELRGLREKVNERIYDAERQG